jgi:1,4-alpha-glucan branching enzyme
MARGLFSLVLHAHLPFIRHPEYPDFLEERWFFEAMSESYLPFLAALRRLEADKVPYRFTLSVSPTLQAMMSDPLLKQRYIAYLERQIGFASREAERSRGNPAREAISAMYSELYIAARESFVSEYEGNILKGFDFFHKKGRLELITTTATHAFMPAFIDSPEAASAQIETAIISHRKNFGRNPSGMWLPHFGYAPGLEKALKAYNIAYAIVDHRSVIWGEPSPFAATYAPVRCPNGLVLFPRDAESTRAVCDSREGYPAASQYRDFYRDLGYELGEEAVKEFLPDGKTRVPTGFKYCSIGGAGSESYDSRAALRLSGEHAKNFAYNRIMAFARAGAEMERAPLLLAAYDMELLGHWWFEGIPWLESLLREIASRPDEILAVTPSDCLAEEAEYQVLQPEAASSSEDGHSSGWTEGGNAWIWRHVMKASERMVDLADRFPNESGLKERALNQAAREVLLAQSSDWPHLMRSEPSAAFARTQLESALSSFNRIYDMLSRNAIATEWLTRLEKKDNLFPFINYRMYRRKN